MNRTSPRILTVLALVAVSSAVLASQPDHHHHSHHKDDQSIGHIHHNASVYEMSTIVNSDESTKPSDVSADPDLYLSFEQIVKENGFQYEEHTVTTKDGYILKIFRIPGRTTEATTNGKKVALLQHGILDSADCWISHRANVAPAFQVVRAGYDVWLGNSRGNKYSHSHRNPSISNKDYWSFSFADMGTGDLPAVITYIKAVTGQDKLAFIGHSQGTTQMYYALAKNEDFYANSISVFVALGPVMKLTNSKSNLLQLIAHNDALLLATCQTLGIYEFFPANWLTTGAMRLLCGTLPSLCQLGDYLIADEDLSLDDKDRLTVYFGHFPSGTSLYCLDHYSQILKADRFQEFDYGKSENKKRYNSPTPPEINIQGISKVPIAMFVGTKDELADSADNLWAKTQLKTLAFYQEYALGHLTFMIGNDMSYFNDVLNILQKYHPSSSSFIQ
eukprot:403345077